MLFLRFIFGGAGLIVGYLVAIHFWVIPEFIVFVISLIGMFALLFGEEYIKQAGNDDITRRLPPTSLFMGLVIGIIIGYFVLNGLNFNEKLEFLKNLFIP